jgi:hypothetical protein
VQNRGGTLLRVGLTVLAITALAPVIAACQTDSPGYYRDYAWNDDDYYSGWGGYDRGYYDHDRSDYWRYRRYRNWNDRDHDRHHDRNDRNDRSDRNRDHDDNDRHSSSNAARLFQSRPSGNSGGDGGGHQDNRPNTRIPWQFR